MRGNLMVAPAFAARSWPRARRAAAVARRISVPGLVSILPYFDGYRSARLGANLIQAQRNCFGAHSYERTDRPGTFHGPW